MSKIEVGKVGMVPIEKIIVGERAREELGDIKSLEENMKESGLITPLAVKDNKDGTYTLLAGGRRFTVLKKNNVKEIPVRFYNHDLSELEMKVIEKSENFHRKDMEYWELDKLTLEIHRMQQKLKGEKSAGPTDKGWGIKDTGELIGGLSKASVSMAIKRAEAREKFPELFEDCKTQKDATKLLKQIDEAVVKESIAKKLKEKSSVELKKLSNSFIIKDFFEGVKEIPNEVFHLVEIDPPYAINLKEIKRSNSNVKDKHLITDYNEIPIEKYQDFLSNLFKECYRVMAQHSWLICWFAPEPWFETIYQELTKAGFETSRICGVWNKGSGQTNNPNFKLANSYELFFYARKGKPVINKAGRSNVFSFNPLPAMKKVHPTERPVELTTEIYETFAFKGSRVLIPFLGSGNGLISAHQLGMSAVGFELTKAYKDSFLVKVNNLFSN